MATLRAPHPLIHLSKNPKSNIIPVSQLPTLLAPVPRVPRRLTRKTKQPLAIGTRRPPHRPPALVHHRSRANPVGTVAPIEPQQSPLAQKIAPLVEQHGRYQGPAANGVDQIVAVQAGALDLGGPIVFDFDLGVLGYAIGAEGVGAEVVVCEFLGWWQRGFDADFAGEVGGGFG